MRATPAADAGPLQVRRAETAPLPAGKHLLAQQAPAPAGPAAAAAAALGLETSPVSSMDSDSDGR
jgi:hypothetical protein